MYGRARRLDLIKKISITLGTIIGIILVARLVVSVLVVKDNSVEYAQLKKYLNGKGFSCEPLKNSGAACKYSSEKVTERFIRYDKGFDYLYNNKSYIVEIYHIDGEDRILFSTGDDSFSNYKNLKYNCTYKDNILNEIDECVLVDDNETKLDNEAYKGIINKKIYEVNMIIEASGYNKNILLKDYKWNKK